MKFVADLHTHTIVSGHAYSTLMENAKYANEIGLEILGVTDHGPNMPGSPDLWYFGNFKVLPRELYGVKMLYGCEANIIDYEGNLDLPLDLQKGLDIMIVSMHEPLMEGGKSADLNTAAILKAMDNPNVNILGHLGNPKFPIHEEEIVKKAKEKNILIELNNSSFITSRIGSDKNCTKIAKLCIEFGGKIIVNSDAHFCFSIGNFSSVEKLLKDIDMPEELIVNTNRSMLIEFLREKGKNV
ncbi:phosphatase [Clostridium tagluense]|uniref:phosphatase n=1 Tax=Clostridium TaxID=1485 RepID=UPI0013E956FF|nr:MULTISPECIES: phosphatase [Clostridium]MBZ9623499.1 phosphatase [Clostridium sp. FP2]MCB2310834.1 phosphatase [Clostridium tagluense]MCB2315688.1 phosphatase [Clostridium tagluense]MCB2320668.1 phosphatase [Clostridium tagluense]MCB2325427.1 phosphatase [Clostridium tagluense]